MGLARDQVHRSVRVFNNQLADPDAIEIVLDDIHGNLNCRRNSMVSDSGDLGRQPVPARSPSRTPSTASAADSACWPARRRKADRQGLGPF